MQIKETPDGSFPGVVESPPLEDVVVLVDSAGVALGVQRAFSARVRSVRDDGSGLIASRCCGDSARRERRRALRGPVPDSRTVRHRAACSPPAGRRGRG